MLSCSLHVKGACEGQSSEAEQVALWGFQIRTGSKKGVCSTEGSTLSKRRQAALLKQVSLAPIQLRASCMGQNPHPRLQHIVVKLANLNNLGYIFMAEVNS